MHKSTLFFIGLLSLVAGILGYNYFFQPLNGMFAQSVPVEPPSEQVVENVDPVSQALKDMSPEEKIAQLMLIPLEIDQNIADEIATESAVVPDAATESAETNDEIAVMDWLAAFKPAGVTLFGSNITKDTAQDTISQVRDALVQKPNMQNKPAVHPIIAVDHEGGVTQRFTGEGFTRLPSWKVQCSQEISEIERQWQISAVELEEVGINMVLAPVVDFAENHPILGTRICSSDPGQVVLYASAWYQTFFNAGIQPVFKHFPGIGKTTADLHTGFESVTVGSQEAAVYELLISNVENMEPQPPLAVMASHVGVTNQFAEIPCSLSEACLQELLSIAPDVLIVSDALEMEATKGENRSLIDVTRLAIRAGNHILVYGPGLDLETFDEIKADLGQLYVDSPTFRGSVDQAVNRVLKYKYSMVE